MNEVWKVLIQYYICVCAIIPVTNADITIDVCNFDKDTCKWESPCRPPSKEQAWKYQQADYWKQPPRTDHTSNQGSGKYMRIQTYHDAVTGCLEKSIVDSVLPKCLSFWYFINGSIIDSFEVNNDLTTISTIDFKKQNNWYQHFVQINLGLKNIKLIAKFGIYNGNDSGFGRYIVVDDATIADSVCPVQPNSTDPPEVPTTTLSSMIPETSDTTVGLPDNAATSSNTSKTTGIIVGVVLGIGFIVGLVIFLWCFITRSKYVRKKSASHDNQILSNDYTAHQSVALPPLLNTMSNSDGYTEIQTKSNNYQHVNSHLNTSGRNYAKLDQLKSVSDNKAAHSLDANGDTNHDYIYLDETEVGSTQTSVQVPGVNMLNEEKHNSNEYAVIDPNCDHLSGKTKDVTHSTPSPTNYAILDPHETGFFRSKGSTTEYDLAVPINDNTCVSDLHDPYSVSENGTYDSTNMVRHNEAETHIYNHAVENVYDTSSRERKIVDTEGNYDHFFGDETEDNYNITKRE